MKKALAELEKRGSYITEMSSEKSFKETLIINEEDLLIALNYKDGIFNKCTKLKLLVFKNENIFDVYLNWIFRNQIDGKNLIKRFHCFSQHNFISKTFLVLLTPKTEYNYFMGENTDLILKKLNQIERLLKIYR